MDFSQIERILTAITTAGAGVPDHFYARAGSNQLDPLQPVQRARSKLAGDIGWAYTMREIAPDLSSAARAKARTQAIQRVMKLARSLRELIDNEALPLRPSLSRHFPRTAELDASVAGLVVLENAANGELDRLTKAGLDTSPPFDDYEWTPGDSFIIAMAESFEKHFGPIAFKADTTREPQSPFIAFVQQIAREMNETVPSNYAVRVAVSRVDKRSHNKLAKKRLEFVTGGSGVHVANSAYFRSLTNKAMAGLIRRLPGQGGKIDQASLHH
ncbi:MAG: hypothetical protein AB7I34_15230 [Rhizobiaceae bacterium]